MVVLSRMLFLLVVISLSFIICFMYTQGFYGRGIMAVKSGKGHRSPLCQHIFLNMTFKSVDFEAF